jgi:hypothetical protein
MEENWPSVQVFLACRTQWRRIIAPMTGHMITEGLDYQGVRDVLWAHGHHGDKARDIFADVQIMEYAAIEALADEQAKKK